ncbi:Ku protein [Methylovirgula sp. HY1]|uniref:non-homologous end joining protein Ku n=1 Tax=Methylovirgula sp. HY1 TaxID=2822761 RepID=UPI001C5BD9C9|nr:Ku protein [Methylovirgula sp. HY1]QXX74291.1 Non-homologous end joining protein Ku [Methylovirgula sp. HY1]
MAPRANWKGFLKLAELSFPVSLYSAVSGNERLAFHMINRETGHRLRRRFVDEETEEAVAKEDLVKGYEISAGQYVMLEPEEIAAVIPESDKTLSIEAFIDCDEIDDLYFDRPYYLAPSDAPAEEGFALLHEGMRKKKVGALARAVLFRRFRTMLIRPHEQGFIATTLNFDYEVRSAEAAFADIPEREIEGEMLDLAKHIIETKRDHFDPRSFEDRYEAGLAELVRAKQEGKPIDLPKPAGEAKIIDLMEALRRSARAIDAGAARAKGRADSAHGRKSSPAKKAAVKKAAGKKAPAKKAAAKAAARRGSSANAARRRKRA